MKKLCGFTLLELLLAATISSIIILSLYSAFHTGILSYRKIDSVFEVYQSARSILNRIELDLKNSYAYTANESYFYGTSDSLNFFAVTDRYQDGKVSSGVCRVVYELHNTTLTRSCYNGIEGIQRNLLKEGEELSLEVKSILLKYISLAQRPENPYEEQDTWPKENGGSQKGALPLAVKVTLTLREPNSKQGQGETAIQFDKIVPLPLAGNATAP